jgi:hypothetical protein
MLAPPLLREIESSKKLSADAELFMPRRIIRRAAAAPAAALGKQSKKATLAETTLLKALGIVPADLAGVCVHPRVGASPSSGAEVVPIFLCRRHDLEQLQPEAGQWRRGFLCRRHGQRQQQPVILFFCSGLGFAFSCCFF